MGKRKRKRNNKEPKVRLYSSKLDDLREMCEWIEQNPEKPPAFVPEHLQYLVPWNAYLCGWGSYWGLFESRTFDHGWHLNPNWRDIIATLEIAGRPARTTITPPIKGEQVTLL